MYFRLDISNFNNLAEALAAIPADVTSLDLSHNSLGHKTGAEIAEALAAIPADVTSLDLTDNDLSLKTGTEIAEALDAIPAGVTSLNLSRNGLGHNTAAEIAEALATIPAGVTSLDLSGNNFCSKIAHVLTAIPAGVTSLDLSVNNLSFAMAEALAAIPAGVTSLDLSRNNLGSKTGVEIAKILAAIPAGVTSLNLSGNRFNLRSGVEIAEALAGIPADVTSLNLSKNYLGAKTVAEIAEALAAIPASVTSLNLSDNDLDRKTTAEIAQILAAIPAGVTSLNLSENDLDRKTTAEIAKILAAIPACVTSLSLDFDIFIDVNHAIKLDVLLGILSSSVTTVIINGKDYNVSDILLNAVFPENERGNSLYWEGGIIKPHCDIDTETLLQFIQYFQKHPSPIHFLASGLLLQGIIENSVDENRANNAAYFVKRLLLAIDFYRKAACDTELAPKVEHILWNMRIVYHDIPAVIEKLEPFRLKPMIEVYDEFIQDTRENYQKLADHSDAEIELSEKANQELKMSTKITVLAIVLGALACKPQNIASGAICAIAIGLLAYSIGLVCEASTCHLDAAEKRNLLI